MLNLHQFKYSIEDKKENRSKLDAIKKKKIRRKSRAAALTSRLDNLIEFDSVPPDQRKRKIKLFPYKFKRKKTDQGSPGSVPGDTPGSSAELISKIDRIINLGDPRPRNQLGEFQPPEEGAPDPNSMARVYNSGQRTGILEGAGAALAGGGLGAVGAGLGKTAHRSAGKGMKSLLTKLKSARSILRK